MTCERTQQRPSRRTSREGKRLWLERNTSRNASLSMSSSLSRMCLIILIISVIGTHNDVANAKSPNRPPFHLSNLRGGARSDGNLPSGGGDLNDDDLDEYIDFLLAFADDKATEADNPLFRDSVNYALEAEEAGEEEETMSSIEESSASNDAILEPLVDDVNDDAQIDAMVETLVASVDDKDLDGETDVDTSTIGIQEATQADEMDSAVEVEVLVDSTIDEDATPETPILASADGVVGDELAGDEKVESDSFYLGSSAVENMPLPVNVEGDVAAEAAEVATEPAKKAPLFSSFMEKIGLKKKESPLADTTVVDPADPIEEITTSEEDVRNEAAEIVLDPSDATEEPVITISEPVSEPPIVDEAVEEQPAKISVASSVKQYYQGALGSVKDFWSKKPVITASEPDREAPIVDEDVGETPGITMREPVSDEAVDRKPAKISVASSVKQYYDGALGSVKDVWSKKPWYKKREKEVPARDYSKIYQKYFAKSQETSDEDDVTTKEEPNRLRSAFLKPWGTVSKYITEETSPAEYYSIGIKGLVADEMTPDTASQVEIDAEKLEEAEETIEYPTAYSEEEIQKEELDVEVLVEEAPVGSESITSSTENEVDSKEISEDTKLVTDGIEAEAASVEETEVVIEVTEAETSAEEVSEDADIIAESIAVEAASEKTTEDVEVITEAIEAEVQTEEVLEDAEIVAEVTEAEIDVEEGPEVVDEIEVEAEIGVQEVPELVEEIEVEAEIDVEHVPEVVEEIEVNAYAEEGLAQPEGISEGSEEEVDAEEVTLVVEDANVDIEEVFEVVHDVDVVIDVDEVPADEEDMAESIEVQAHVEVVEDMDVDVDVDVEAVPADEEGIAESFEVEYDAEDVPADEEGIEAEVNDEVIAAETVVIADSIEIQVEVDAEEIPDVVEDVEVEVSSEVPADEEDPVESFEVEVDTEEAAAEKEDLEVRVEVDTEEISEVVEDIEVEVDVAEVPASEADIGEDFEVEVDAEEIPADEEDIEVDEEETPETEEDIEVDEEEIPEVLAESFVVEVEVDAEEIAETEEESVEGDSIEDTQVEIPRRANIFARLWGTKKVHDTIDIMQVDDEMADEATEETPEDVDSEMIPEEGSRKPNAFIRLWGTTKEPNQVHSLGLGMLLRGIKTSEGVAVASDSSKAEDFETLDDEENYVEEELDVDVSVSIGVVDDGDESLDSPEISKSSGAEEMEDGSDVLPLAVTKSGPAEDIQDARNVLQLDIPEVQESVPETASIELTTAEDTMEINEITTLQLHQENSFAGEDTVGSDETIDEVTEESEMEVQYYNDVAVNEDSIEEAGEEEEETEFVVADAEAVEGEQFIEEFNEEEYVEDSFATNFVEVFENEEEEEVYVAEKDEEESFVSQQISSSPYSLEVEMQTANFLTRFLVSKGLEQVIMIAFVIAEWFRMYVLAPFLESVDWVVKGKGQDLLQSVIKTRGGGQDLFRTALNTRGGATLSESEDVEQTTNEEEDVEMGEDVSAEEQGADLGDSENSKSDSNDDLKLDPEQVEQLPSPSRQVPPNFIYRRLLGYGSVGHVIIMEMVLASEWLNLYVPDIRSIANFIVYDVLRQKKRSGRGSGEPVNYMTAGFVNIGDGSRLQRKPKKQRKKEDQKALDQLKSVGNVNEARYRFISESFMERHELGPYNVAFSEIELDLGSTKEVSISKENDGAEDGAGSDSGWILDALGVEEEDDSPSSVPFDTSIGVSMGSGGPQVSVGVGVTIGKKKKRSSSQKLRNVIEGNSSNGISSKGKKPLKPHLSDSESGIMGRLRASGANSLVGRSILGAYPGDLPSPDEAADSRGVAYMARRYGYGDWSDEEDESDENPLDGDGSDDDEGSLVDNLTKQETVRPKKRSKSGTKAKKRRSSSSRTSASTLAVSSSVSGSISTSASRRRRKTRRSQLPSLAMQTLGEKAGSGSAATKSTSSATSTKKTSQSSDASSIKDTLLGSTKREKKFRPAMSILNDTKKSSSSTNAKSQNEDQ